MGCLGGGRSDVVPRPEQTWAAITLQDFKSKSCWTGTAYVYLYFSVILSLAVYGVDIFTAVNLLAFDTWSSQLTPPIPPHITKWIFSICIILSVVNLIYEFIVATRVMKRGNVAECYLDNLGVRLESLRWGKGQGWRRFLVFSALTKSDGGAEYIALFTYFSFQSWFRVVVCSGPRQVVNATTLYAVYKSKLIPTDLSTVESTLETFFAKLAKLYSDNSMQAVILSGMIFTLVIWVFTFIFLVMAVIFFVFFLWHWIPKGDSGLHGYCERKVNKRLMKIVSKKMNKAIMKEEERQRRANARAVKGGGPEPSIGRQATLPQLLDQGNDDKLPEMPRLARTDTMATLPQYTSRAASPSIELNPMDQKRPYPLSRNGTTTTASSGYGPSTDQKRPYPMSRSGTTNTVSSGYASSVASSRAPLMGSAANMGRSTSPTPTLPRLPQDGAYGNYPPSRPTTANSYRTGAPSVMSDWEDPYTGRSASPVPSIPSLPPIAGYGNYPPPARTGTSNSYRNQDSSMMSEREIPGRAPSAAPSMRSYAPAPALYGEEPMPSYPPMTGSPAPSSMGDPYGRPVPRAVAQLSGRSGVSGPPSRYMPDDQRNMMEGRASPAPSSIYSEQPGPAPGPRYNGPAYVPPTRSNTGPMGPAFDARPPPQRNMTAPVPPRMPMDPYARQGTPGAQSVYSAYDDDVESQRGQRW
ncbi:Fungal potassium channel [Microdochium nivale]|nr:Fungal potassium channel [Microdochium nivale]